jgi:hypothetical protein
VRERALRQRRDLHRPAGRLRMRLPARLHGQELPAGRERVRELALPARLLLRPGEYGWAKDPIPGHCRAVHGSDPNVQFDQTLHCKKRLVVFPSPAGMVSDIPTGDGNTVNLVVTLLWRT